MRRGRIAIGRIRVTGGRTNNRPFASTRTVELRTAVPGPISKQILDRIERHNPQLHAFIAVYADPARAALRSRQTCLDLLDRRFFREEYDARQFLNRFVTDALHVTTAGDLERRVRAAIDQALHAGFPALIAAHDVFCLPSRSEGFPLASPES